jgi:SAM-dependent methyltransferase
MRQEQRRLSLRTVFEEVPDLYDRARPTYPPELFDDLASLATLSPGSRILEIGCGTGKATLPLAERGYDVTCVELGEQLAEYARRKLAAFPSVEVVTADFEIWQPPAPYDAIVAFTAFHWIDPTLRYEKSAAALREDGALAVVATKHVLPADGDPFFVDVQDDYRRVAPDDEDGPPPRPDDVPDLADEIAASGLFGDVTVRRYVWDVVYTAAQYVDVLGTYSEHRALNPAARDRLFARIRRRIESRSDGTVRKSYLATLNLARRRSR